MPPRSPTTVGMAVETTVISIAAIERLSKSEMTVSGRFVFIERTRCGIRDRGATFSSIRASPPDLRRTATSSLPALKPTGRYFATAKPESATAFSRSAGFVLVSSYFTITWPFSRSAEADSTPLTCLSLASVFAGHFSHFQPLTLMVSVFTFARAAVLEASANANTIDDVFMSSPSRETPRHLSLCRAPVSMVRPASSFANGSRSAMMPGPRFPGGCMRKIPRRTVLGWGLGVAAGRALGQAAKVEPVFKPEKDASLRLLRWSGFVKSDEELWNANTKKFTEATGVPVSVEYITWEDVRPKAALAANLGTGPDIIMGWYDDPHIYPQKLVDVSDVAEGLGKQLGGWYDVARTYGYSNTIAIAQKPSLEAIAYVQELYAQMVPGVGSWLDPNNNRAFLAGEISLTNNGISIYYAAKKDFPQIAEDINHSPFPIGPVGRATELANFSQAFIFKHSRFPNAAKEYIRFMLSPDQAGPWVRSEEHTSELQSPCNLVCRLLLEKKKKKNYEAYIETY